VDSLKVLCSGSSQQELLFVYCLQNHLLWRRVMRSSSGGFSCVMAFCNTEYGASIAKEIFKYGGV
jgi:hypothetical protein